MSINVLSRRTALALGLSLGLAGFAGPALAAVRGLSICSMQLRLLRLQTLTHVTIIATLRSASIQPPAAILRFKRNTTAWNFKKEPPMKLSTLIAGAVVATGMAFSAAPSQAAPASLNLLVADQSMAQQVHYRPYFHRHNGIRLEFGNYGNRRYGYCRSWRHECAERWGWGTWRFNRCLARHGC